MYGVISWMSSTALIVPPAIFCVLSGNLAVPEVPRHRLALAKSNGRHSLHAGRPCCSVERERSDHEDAGTDLHAVVETDHVLVAHADATRRHLRADRPGLVRAVNAIE